MMVSKNIEVRYGGGGALGDVIKTVIVILVYIFTFPILKKINVNP